MDYNTERDKCIHDPVYFIEHYIIVNGKHLKLTPLQKLLINKINKHGRKWNDNRFRTS